MKNNIKRLISVLLCGLMFFFQIVCNENHSDGQGSNDDQVQLEPIDGQYILKNGTTDYKILLPESQTDIEAYAASELQNFFYEATGVELEIVKEETETAAMNKYFSVGDTQFCRNANITFGEGLNSQSFKLKTVDETIVIVGKGEYGTLWGVYEMVAQLFDYEYFAADAYVINRNVKELPLYEFDYQDSPDIEYRCAANGQTYSDTTVARRMRFVNPYEDVFIEGLFGHTSFKYFGGVAEEIDERFMATTGKQLCYTAHGNETDYQEMLGVAFESLVNYVNADERLDKIMLGVQDYSKTICTCEGCAASKQKYGTDSAAVIIFCNNLHRMLENYFAENNVNRSVDLLFFAYNDVEAAPVTKDENGNWQPVAPELKCDPGVYAMLAAIKTNWWIAYEDEGNINHLNTLLQWRALSDELYLWTYHTNYTHYLIPFDCFNNLQRNYQLFDELNVQYLFDQGRTGTSNATSFFTLREYLSSKLSWDVNADLNQLTEEFFEIYYGAAKGEMREIYDELRMLMAYIADGMSAGVYNDISLEKYWPQALIFKWMGKIDAAYEKIEDLKTSNPEQYEFYWKHITKESIFVRYIYLLHYADTLSSETKEMQNQFVKDCLDVGISRSAEGVSVTELFK